MNQKSIQEAAKRLNKVKHAEQSGELEIVLYGYFFSGVQHLVCRKK